MHILIIVSWYKDKTNPISGSFFEEQARGLLRKGIKVGIIYPDFINFSSEENKGYNEFDDDGLLTITQKVKAIIPHNFYINYRYLAYSIFKKGYKNYITKNGKPDIIHSHVYKFAGHVGLYISKKEKIPHFYTEHFSSLINPKVNLHKSDYKLAKNVILSSDVSICVSNFLKKEICKKVGVNDDKFIVIPNIVSNLFLNSTYTTSKEGVFRFINIGSLIEVKNQILLVNAFAKYLSLTNVKSELLIIGEGIKRKDIENEIVKLGVEDSVKLLGLKSRNETLLEIQKSNVGVISSHIETFSVAGLEFLSQGLPIISTDCGGPSDYINDDNGVIVINDNIDTMSQAMLKINNRYNSYNSEKIIIYIYDNFSEQVVISKLINIYKKYT